MRRRSPSTEIFATAFFLLPITGIFAQNSAAPPVALPEVVVTASPGGSLVSPSAEEAEERLSQVPGAANVVTPEEYQLGRGAYLEDFLRYAPGVFIQSAQGSEDTKVSVRGSGIQSDDLAGLEILLDGVPLNQADGEAYLQDLDLRAVKYAEVYRGADALRYGAITLGGAVNLVTYTGRETDQLTALISAGSFGFLEEHVSSGWSSGPWDAYFSATNHVLDGFREHSQENSQKVMFALGYALNDSAENRFYFFYGHSSQNNPESITKEEMDANPRQADPEAIEQRWNTAWDYTRLMDRFVIKGNDSQVQLGASWNHRNFAERQEFEDDFRLGNDRFYSDDLTADATYESTHDFLGARNRFSLGLVPTYEVESDAFNANIDGRYGPVVASDRTLALNLPVYLENQHYLTKSLSLLTSFQGVYVRRVFRDTYNSVVLGNQSNTENFYGLSPKFGLLYEWNEKNQTYLNVSRSFQPPSFDESLSVQEGTDGGEVFDRLRPQVGWTAELGTRGKAGIFSWDVAIYRSWLHDELLDLSNGQGVPLGTVNADRTYHEGIEAELETELLHWGHADTTNEEKQDRVVFEQSYTMNDFHFSDDTTYGRNRIAGVPVHLYKAELRYESPCGFYLGPNIEWSIVKYPADEANTLFADPYALLGFRAGYKSRKGFDVFFEAKNLTDKIYASAAEPVGNAQTEGDDLFDPGDGRAFYGGVSWTW